MSSKKKNKESLKVLLMKPRVILFMLLHSIFVFKLLILFIFKNRTKSSIFILNVGGFGHTITQADTYFNYIDPNGIVLALLTPKIHNLKISMIYKNNYHAIDRTKHFTLIDSKKERLAFHLSELITLRIVWFIFAFFPNSPKLYDWRSIVALVPREKLGIYGKGIVELFFGIQRNDVEGHFRNHINFQIYEKLTTDLKNKFPGNRFCAFYFRNKGLEGQDDKHNYTRNTRTLNELIPLFEYLKNLGFMILLYGDNPSSFKQQAKRYGVVFFDDVGWEKDTWDIWVGGISEFTLGSPGGGLLIPVKFGKKILVLDGFGYWFAVPNAMHSYKLVFTKDGELISPMQLIKNSPWQLDFPPDSVIKFIPVEILKNILEEFYSQLNTWADNNKNLEINEECWLNIAPGAIISKKYLKFVNSYL